MAFPEILPQPGEEFTPGLSLGNHEVLLQRLIRRGDMKDASITADIPAVSFAVMRGITMLWLTPAVKPRWSPRTNAPAAAKAALSILPFSSIS